MTLPSDGHSPSEPNLKLWFGSKRLELRQSSEKQQAAHEWCCTCWMIISKASSGKNSMRFLTAVALEPRSCTDLGFSWLYLRITPAASASPQDLRAIKLCTHCMTLGAFLKLPRVLTRKLARSSSRLEVTATTWQVMLHIDRKSFGAA